MTRILLVGKGPPDRGGISAYLQMLLNNSELRSAHDLRLLNLTRDEPPQGGRLTSRNMLRTLEDMLAVWRAAEASDVVHIHSALVPHVTLIRAGLLALSARLRRGRVILHVHSGAVQTWLAEGRGRRLLARLSLSPANAVVTVDRGSLAELAQVVGTRNLALVENGVDLAAYGPPGPTHTPPRVLYAGLLTERKGVVDLLAASQLLRERGVAHQLLLAGGTPDEGIQAETVVRHAARASSARLLGPQPHERMAEWYRSVDVFCLPSWYEAMPLSVLEAMASGLPVVASAVGDIPRAVLHGVTGCLVPPHQPQQLADALERLLTDSGLRRDMGVAGQRHMQEHFDARQTATAMGQLYERLGDEGT